MTDQKELAVAAARYTMSKIIPIQRGYIGSNHAAIARARAVLARLRRLNAPTGGCAFQVGDELFGSWPQARFKELGACRRDEDRFANVVETTLGLYALHQQSSSKACAVVRKSGEDDEAYRAARKAASFGRACREIERDLSKASGVQRRLRAIEAAGDFDGIVYGVRGLIRLMKPSGGRSLIQLDYGGLAHDLYLLQLGGGWRDNVIARWSRDYFAYMPETESESAESN